MITLLETKLWDGDEIVAVTDGTEVGPSCTQCVGYRLPRCQTGINGYGALPDCKNIIWMRIDDAIKARLRGRIQ